MECLVLPLHEKLEEWKKMAINLDKDHAKGEQTFPLLLMTLIVGTLIVLLYLQRNVGRFLKNTNLT